MTAGTMHILEAGTLTERRDRATEAARTFEIRLLGTEHLDEVCDLQQLVVDTLEDPVLYHPDPRELLRQCLGERGAAVGTFVGGRLVGFRSVFYPGDRPDNLGHDICLEETSLDLVAHLERAAVDPAYRGNRLQIRMTAHAIRLAMENHRWRHLFSTVAPTNFASMKDKFTVGMQIVRTTKKYLDYWRHVFYRDIVDPVGVDPGTSLAVDSNDLARQLALVEEQGYVGYQLERQGQGTVVKYAKPTRVLPRGRRIL